MHCAVSRTGSAKGCRGLSMTLSEFDVLGEEISDEETEEIVKKGDPRRSLVRYRPAGSELFVSARINLPLLRAAVPLPVLLLKPSSRDDEVLKPRNPALEAAGGWDLLTPEGSRRNWGLLERICEDLTKASVSVDAGQELRILSKYRLT